VTIFETQCSNNNKISTVPSPPQQPSDAKVRILIENIYMYVMLLA